MSLYLVLIILTANSYQPCFVSFFVCNLTLDLNGIQAFATCFVFLVYQLELIYSLNTECITLYIIFVEIHIFNNMNIPWLSIALRNLGETLQANFNTSYRRTVFGFIYNKSNISLKVTTSGIFVYKVNM